MYSYQPFYVFQTSLICQRQMSAGNSVISDYINYFALFRQAGKQDACLYYWGCFCGQYPFTWRNKGYMSSTISGYTQLFYVFQTSQEAGCVAPSSRAYLRGVSIYLTSKRRTMLRNPTDSLRTSLCSILSSIRRVIWTWIHSGGQ